METAHLYYHLVLPHALVYHLGNHLIPNSVVTPTFMTYSPMSFYSVYVLEVETVVVPDNDITDGLNHDDDDLYDPSYEIGPFDISTSVDTIQTHVSKSITRPVSMDEKACENQDKWFKINYKTKD
jgi:hypothetical protein